MLSPGTIQITVPSETHYVKFSSVLGFYTLDKTHLEGT